MASQAKQPGGASTATAGVAGPMGQMEQKDQRALLDRAFELAVKARHAENPHWVTALTPKSKDGLDVYQAVVRDSKGQFYVFASPLENAVLGAIVPRSDQKASVKTWFLDGSSSDAPVDYALPWAKVDAGDVCDLTTDFVVGYVAYQVCSKFLTCWIAGSITKYIICNAEAGEPFRFNPALKSADWDNEATGESGVSNVSQCCGSPYYLIADIHIHANSCHPSDYPNRREHIVRVCHETDVTGQKIRRQVQWRVSYFWPDGTRTSKIYTCECTLITPAYLFKSVAVPPGEYILGISVEEGFEFIGFHGTGNVVRYYRLTP